MDSKILLGKILQRFKDQKITKVEGYNTFEYIKEQKNKLYVTRENGKDTAPPSLKSLLLLMHLKKTRIYTTKDHLNLEIIK